MGNTCFLAALLTWSLRRWLVAGSVAVGTYLFFGLSTAVLANPVFGREVAPTPWAPEVLIATAILSGLLTATYVRNEGRAPLPIGVEQPEPGPRSAKAGALGSLLAYLAIGCPVCNKLALLLLGSSGAMSFYAPIQPYLGAIGIGLLSIALVIRLRGEISCATLAQARSGALARPLTTEAILADLPARRGGRDGAPAEPSSPTGPSTQHAPAEVRHDDR